MGKNQTFFYFLTNLLETLQTYRESIQNRFGKFLLLKKNRYVTMVVAAILEINKKTYKQDSTKLVGRFFKKILAIKSTFNSPSSTVLVFSLKRILCFL